MTGGRLRVRALVLLVSAVVAAQSAIGAMPVAAASPAPSATPVPSPAPTPAAATSPTPTAPASPTPTGAPTPTAAPSPAPTVAPLAAGPGLKTGATELTSRRTETSATWDNHDGTYTTRAWAAPVFYRPSGSSAYQPVQAGFAAGASRDALTGLVPAVTSDRAPAAVSLFDAGAADFLSVSSATARVGFALPAALAKAASGVKPMVSGGHADYAGILAGGAGLRVFAGPSGSKSFIVLQSAPKVTSWTFRVDAPGLTLALRPGGYADLVDASGVVQGWIPQPYAVDSAVDALRGGGTPLAGVSLSVGKDVDGTPTITISADPAMLAAATYPLYVDPSVTLRGTNVVADAHTASFSPYNTHNYASYFRPDTNEYEMWLGTDPSGTTGTSYDFISFDLSSIDSHATVDSASVSMYAYHQYYNAPTVERTWVNKVTGSWSETGVTGSAMPAVDTTNLTFIDAVEGVYSTSNPSSTFNAMVQDWVTTPSHNHGIREWENNGNSTYWKRQYSSEQGGTNRPTIDVTYHITPTVASTTPSFSSSVGWSFASFGGLGQAQYRVDVATDSAFTQVVATSGDVSSGAAAWRVVPTAPSSMTDDAQYWYRVRVNNGTSWSSWAQGQFTWDAYQRGDEPYYTQVPFDIGGGWGLEVGAHNGAATLSRSFFTIPSYGPPQSLELSYSSAGPSTTGMFGSGWSSNLTQYLTFENGLVVWHRPDGGRIAFPAAGGAAYGGHYETLAVGTSLAITRPDQTKLTFQTQAQGGRLLSIANRFGKTLALAGWGTSTVTATDVSGRQTVVTIDTANSRVTQVRDSASRIWAFSYAGTGSASDLVTITEPDPDLLPVNGPLPPAVSTFGYTAHQLTTLARDRRTAAGGTDHIVWTIGYSGGLVSTVQGPVNAHPDSFSFGAGSAAYTKVADETTTPVTSAVTTYALDGLGRPTVIAQPEGVTTTRGYTAGTRNATSESTPTTGGTASTGWAWDAAGNMTSESVQIIDPADTANPDHADAQKNHLTTVYTYNATNDLLTRTDADNSDALRTVTKFGYDAAGHLTSEIRNCTSSGTTVPAQGAGGSCTGAGTKDPNTNVTFNYAYNGTDQLEYEQSPLGVVTKHVYDPAYGYEVAVIEDCTSSGTALPSPFTSCTTTGTGQPGRTYDSATNVVTQTAYSNSVTAGKIGLPTSTTDPVGNTTASTYDELGERLTEVLPGDASIPAQTSTTTYDQLGNVLTESVGWTPVGGGLPVSRTSTHVYDLANRERSSTDPQGTTTTTGYDAAGDAVQTVASGPAGVGSIATTRAFDLLGRTTLEKIGSASPTTISYTRIGAVSGRTLPDLSTQSLASSLTARTTQVQTTGTAGGTIATAAAFDVLGRQTDSTSGAGSVTHTAFDRLGRSTGEIRAYGTGSAATASHAYDAAGNEVSSTDPNGIVTTTTYDRLGRAIKVVANDVASPTLPTQDVTTFTYYDAAGRVAAVTDARGVTTRTVLNARGLAAQSIADCTDSGTTPTGAPASCTGAGTHSDAANIVTATVYDGSGAEVKVTTAVGRPSEATVETAYEPGGQVRATKDPMGTITRNVYNAAGQLTDTYANCTTSGTTIPADWANCTGQGTADRADGTLNIHTSYAYDARGNRASEKAPNGRVTTYTYNDDGDILTTVDNDVASPTLPSEDVTTTYVYDQYGRQAAVVTPTGVYNRTAYNADGTVASTVQNCRSSLMIWSPAGETAPCALGGSGVPAADKNVTTAHTYDARGNVIATSAPDPSDASGTWAALVVTQYAYDAGDRLCRVVQNATGTTDLAALPHPCTDSTQTAGTATANVSTRYAYDGMGNLVSMTDGTGHATTYSYDAAGHMTARTDALGASLMWTYDDLGRRASQRNRTDPIPTQSVSWAYDAQGRTLSRTADGATTSYTYDLAGNRLTASAAGMTVTSTYDRLGRLLTTDDEDAGTAPDTTYSYSITSPSWTDPTGTYQVALDRFDRATSLTDPLGGSFTWAYRADGQPSSAGQPNGNATGCTYDSLGRPLTKVTKTGGTTTQASYAWARNQAGQALSEASTVTSDPTNNTRQYTYDPLGRLASFTDAASTVYTWDSVPNRTGVKVGAGSVVPTTYDAANRPATQNGVAGSYSTDADGRVTARPNQNGTSYQRMTWDHLGRLTSVLPPAGSTPVATYTYDPLDRLRLVDYGTSRIRFRYLGMTTTAVQIVDDTTGSVLRNIGSSWTGEHLEDWDPSATPVSSSLRVYGTNGHGDVTWTAGSAGSVTGTVRYDPFGTATSVTGSVPDFRFQGSWADDTAKLSWVVTRWYATAQGAFISEDSLLGEPRDPDSRHLYAYGQGDPVNRVDPTGRQWSRLQKHTVNLSLWESRAFAVAVTAVAGLACVALAATGQVESFPWCMTQVLAGGTIEGQSRVEHQAVKHQEIWRNTSGPGQMFAYHTKIGIRTNTYRWGLLQSKTTTYAKYDSIEYFETFLSSATYVSGYQLDYVGRQLNNRFWSCGNGPIPDYGPESVSGARGADYGVCHPWAAMYFEWDNPNTGTGVHWTQTGRNSSNRYYRNSGLGYVSIPKLDW